MYDSRLNFFELEVLGTEGTKSVSEFSWRASMQAVKWNIQKIVLSSEQFPCDKLLSRHSQLFYSTLSLSSDYS